MRDTGKWTCHTGAQEGPSPEGVVDRQQLYISSGRRVTGIARAGREPFSVFCSADSKGQHSLREQQPQCTNKSLLYFFSCKSTTQLANLK